VYASVVATIFGCCISIFSFGNLCGAYSIYIDLFYLESKKLMIERAMRASCSSENENATRLPHL